MSTAAMALAQKANRYQVGMTDAMKDAMRTRKAIRPVVLAALYEYANEQVAALPDGPESSYWLAYATEIDGWLPDGDPPL